MVAWSALFEGPDGLIGSTEEGLPFAVMRGSVSRRAGRGYAQPSRPGPFAVVEGGSLANDGTLEGTFPAAGESGEAIYFRLSDLNNYWRAAVYAYTYAFQSGTTQTFIGNETYISGYGTFPTEYEWRQNYTTGLTHNYSDRYNLHFAKGWSTSNTSAPFFPSSLAHYHYLEQPYFPGDDTTHYHYKSGSPYTTGATRGGGSYPIHSTRAVYRTDPVYSTAVARKLGIDRLAGGTLTRRAEVDVPSGVTLLRVGMNGDTLTATAIVPAAGTTAAVETVASVIDGHNRAMTRHGFGYHEADTLGGYTGLDALTFRPSKGGLYTPTLIR